MSLILAVMSFVLWLFILRYQVLLACLVRGAFRFRAPERDPSRGLRFTVLVPAHNEELGIAATIGSLQALDYPRESFRILVIADNCSDQTAAVATACGADVLQRFDASKKSKGYALEYALQKLQLERDRTPDAVVVIDADTRVDPRMLQAFSTRMSLGQDWLQAYYSVSNPDDNWRTKLMTLGFALFNGVWLSGQDAMGLGSALRGNGMAFSWKALQRFPWKAYGLAEDLEFSWHLRLGGERVHFVPEARVYGEIISDNAAASRSQRLRWERGRAELKTLFRKELKAKPLSAWKRFLMQSDLNMPPLSRLVSLSLLSLGLALACVLSVTDSQDLWALGLATPVLAGNILGLLTLSLYLSLPFLRFQLPFAYLLVLYKLPFYMLWKFVLLFQKGPQTWVRTHRNTEPAKKA